MENKGAVLMVTRNNMALSKKALASVAAQDHPCTVLVVDNASADGTPHWLRTKKIAVMATPIQWALSRCWNIGLQALWAAGYDKALVINNDVELRPDTYRRLAYYSSTAPFVSAVSVNSQAQLGEVDDRLPSDLVNSWRPHPDFSCFMICKTVTEKVGWFDEGYFPAFYEDNDYHVRMHRAGVHAGCVDLPFLHHGSQTVKQADHGEQERIKRMAASNKMRFYATYGCIPGTSDYEALFK